MKSLNAHIEHSLSMREAGNILFASDFRGEGTGVAIRKSLSRMVKAGKLLGMGQATVYRKIKRYEIALKRPRLAAARRA